MVQYVSVATLRSQTEEYPLLRIDDIYAKLALGEGRSSPRLTSDRPTMRWRWRKRRRRRRRIIMLLTKMVMAGSNYSKVN